MLLTSITIAHINIVIYLKINFENLKIFFQKSEEIFRNCLRFPEEKWGKAEDLYFEHLAALRGDEFIYNTIIKSSYSWK